MKINYYEDRFNHFIESGAATSSALERVAQAYIDGKPALRGKHKVTGAQRCFDFWSSSFLTNLPAEAWTSQTMQLALAQYLGQERVSNTAMLADVAAVAPDVLVHAVRCSGLVLAQHSPRRTELDHIAVASPVIAELCRVLDIFDAAYRQRKSAVVMWQNILTELSPLELLCYASLYAFEHWVPENMAIPSSDGPVDTQVGWDAVNDILLWKLSNCTENSTRLSDMVIGPSLAKHLSPFLFPSPNGGTVRNDLREAFANLLVQLPWVVGLQNNSTAAINNLRRLGMRRNEARAETQRIETQLGAMLESRGFKVVLNWNPPVGPDGNAGEVDVICARDGTVLVLEVKSSYLRRSQQDAWQHETSTLRRAGHQLRRKVAAVQKALANQPEFVQSLELEGSATNCLCGWIVDTSIECDHQRFGGFLKLSLEELLIALRDDRNLLHDPDGMFAPAGSSQRPDQESLYPDGFSASRLLEVIETEKVWRGV